MAEMEVAQALAEGRSGRWPAVRREFLAEHTQCEACGGTENLEAHHRKPFHLHPALELEPRNLIAICEKSGHDCHFHFGHNLDWKAFNPYVEEDAKAFRERVEKRKYA